MTTTAHQTASACGYRALTTGNVIVDATSPPGGRGAYRRPSRRRQRCVRVIGCR